MSIFEVQITDLLRPNTSVGTPSVVSQFSDLAVHHDLNEGKRAEVTLSIHDPLVADLQPYGFALRVLYEDRREPVFWGPSNMEVDYEQQTVKLTAQDPSLRMQHHYLRRGDNALNDTADPDKGRLTVDGSAIGSCIEAANNTAAQDTRNDPSLGADWSQTGAYSSHEFEVERGQECWDVVRMVTAHALGPDVDARTNFDLFWEYTVFDCYMPPGENQPALGRDLREGQAGAVILEYGRGSDTLVAFREAPGRPTTHAHVLSSDSKYRKSAGDTTNSNIAGIYVDWVATDYKVPMNKNATTGEMEPNTTALELLAKARVGAYGRPPRFMEATLRPDAVLAHSYGHPSFSVPAGTTAPNIYLGDRITVKATRGRRSFNEGARIVGCTLAWPGERGPAVTQLRLVPTVLGSSGPEES